MPDFPERVESHIGLRDQISEALRTKRPSDDDLDKARTAVGRLGEVTWLVEQVAALLAIERDRCADLVADELMRNIPTTPTGRDEKRIRKAWRDIVSEREG